MGRRKVKFRKMELNEGLTSIYPLNDTDLHKITSLAEAIELPKHRTFINQNKNNKYIYFLEKGICRIFYPKGDKEVILDFCFPGNIILPLNSYVLGTLSYEIVDCITACTLHRISIKKIHKLYEASLPIANWGRKLAELETLKIENRLIQNQFKSAAERYHNLLKKEPALLQHIKLGHIANYLGVSQVTLSRIRAEIK